MSARNSIFAIFLSFSFCIGIGLPVSAQDVQIKKTSSAVDLKKYRQRFWDSLPRPISWINDHALLYSGPQRKYLDDKIADFEKETTIEICIVTTDTFCVSKEKFEDLAIHFAKVWAIGKKGKDNGILICISPGYHKLRICNGVGISKYLSDSETKNIIDFTILPEFKKGDYYTGTVYGLNEIMYKLKTRLKG